MAATAMTVVRGKPVPHINVEEERAGLGGLLIDNSQPQKATFLRKVAKFLLPEDLYEPRHTTLYGALLAYLEKHGAPPDLVQLDEYLRKHKLLAAVGGSSYTHELYNSCEVLGNTVDYCRTVFENALERKTQQTAESLALGAITLDEAQRRFDIIRERRRLAESDQGATVDDGVWRPNVQNARDLLSKTFAPIRWAVPGLFAEGLTIMAARPKLGKSTLTLHIMTTVAFGGVALGKIRVDKGTALYLALEDGERRMQERLERQLAYEKEAIPDGLQIVYEWLPLDRGGIDALDRWMDEHPDTRVIGIDTLQRVRSSTKGNSNMYELDYAALAPLQSWAIQRHVAVVVIHHLRKAPSNADPFDEISGSTGLQGVADNLLVLKEANGEVTLYMRGRDIEENALVLKGNKETLLWTLEGEVTEVHKNKDAKALYTALEQHPEGMDYHGIAQVLGKSEGATRVMLTRLMAGGDKHVRKDGHLYYKVSNNCNNVIDETSVTTVTRQAVIPAIPDVVTDFVTDSSIVTADVTSTVTRQAVNVSPDNFTVDDNAACLVTVVTGLQRPATILLADVEILPGEGVSAYTERLEDLGFNKGEAVSMYYNPTRHAEIVKRHNRG